MAEVLVTTVLRQTATNGGTIVTTSLTVTSRVEPPVREQGLTCPSEMATEEWPYITLCALPLGHMEAHEGFVYESDCKHAKPIFTTW